LIREAARLVRNVQRYHPRYAAGAIPMSTSEFAALLRRATCEVYFLEPRPGVRAITIPPIAGRCHIGVKRDLSQDERAFALRHELAHVLAGDADEPVAMVHRGYLTYAERLADLFALADLVPTSYLRSLRSIPLRWNEIREDLAQMIREQWGADWPEARIDDRAALRLRLFRECGT